MFEKKKRKKKKQQQQQKKKYGIIDGSSKFRQRKLGPMWELEC